MRLTIMVDTDGLLIDADDADEDAWTQNEIIMGELGQILTKLANLTKHNAALPAAPVLNSIGETVGSIEWEDI